MNYRTPTSLEWAISNCFGFEHAALFGRARSGLVAAIEEATSLGAPVIIPSNICTAILASVLAAAI